MIRVALPGVGSSHGKWQGTVEDCNGFWVTLSVGSNTKQRAALPLTQVDLSFDPTTEQHLLLHWQS
jgi:hypothetical protein